jgi:DUF1365 family protein
MPNSHSSFEHNMLEKTQVDNEPLSLAKTPPFSQSSIFLGHVIHRRYTPKRHHFKYSLYMLALDVTDIENTKQSKGLFGFSWYHPLRFCEKDYLKSEPFPLSKRITNKVKALNGHHDINRIIMLVQVRCFGVYFSPVNFYFCYDSNDNCTQMLAEVSNTPWNERHYYLVDLADLIDEATSTKETKKVFQVSPFMDLDMTYLWRVKPPSEVNDKLSISIENRRLMNDVMSPEKLFDVTLAMKKQPFTNKALRRLWLQLPVMTLKIVFSIYWQALRIFIKRIPFIGYQKPGE